MSLSEVETKLFLLVTGANLRPSNSALWCFTTEPQRGLATKLDYYKVSCGYLVASVVCIDTLTISYLPRICRLETFHPFFRIKKKKFKKVQCSIKPNEAYVMIIVKMSLIYFNVKYFSKETKHSTITTQLNWVFIQ